MRNKALWTITATTITLASSVALASSHREAPAIVEDPLADNTDVYAFISPTDSEKIVLVANYVPLLIPESGPNFYRFADSARYEIGVDNDGDAVPDVTFQWRFRSIVQDEGTFLYNVGVVDSIDDPDLNVRQFYDLVRIDHEPRRDRQTVIARNVPVAPWNVGSRSFPDYDRVAEQAIVKAGDVTAFAGPRDEPFFVDLHVFDLLGVGGTPTTDGFNVMSLALELPIADVAKDGKRPAADAAGPDAVLGVFARALRQRVRILGRNQGERNFGEFVQVSRLGWPLVNEVIIPLGEKDNFNRTLPKDDVANFGAFILDPEINGLLSAVLGLGCQPTPEGGRVDIVQLLSPNQTVAADLLRINVTEGQTFAQTAFPNGRSLTDDVTDILLTVACNGGFAVSDQVDQNDLAFLAEFPFLASPHSGNP